MLASLLSSFGCNMVRRHGREAKETLTSTHQTHSENCPWTIYEIVGSVLGEALKHAVLGPKTKCGLSRRRSNHLSSQSHANVSSRYVFACWQTRLWVFAGRSPSSQAWPCSAWCIRKNRYFCTPPPEVLNVNFWIVSCEVFSLCALAARGFSADLSGVTINLWLWQP